MKWVRVQIEYGSEDMRRLAEDPDATSRQCGSDVIAAYRKKLQILDGAVDMKDLHALRSVDLEEFHAGSSGQSGYTIRLSDEYRLRFAIQLTEEGPKIVVLELVAISVKGGVR